MSGKKLHIYISNEEQFRALQLEVKTIWYKRFGESLTNSDLLVKALEYLRDELVGGKNRDHQRQDIHKYLRTGSPR